MSTQLKPVPSYVEMNINYSEKSKWGYHIFDSNLKLLSTQYGYSTEKEAWISGKSKVASLNQIGYDEEYIAMH